MNAIPDTTIGAALRQAAATRREAVGWIDRDRPYSWAAMDAAADRLASGLLRAGLGRGDRIGLIGLNQIEWLQVFFAATRIGAVIVGMSVRYRDSELEYMVNDSRVKAVFTLGEHEGFDFFAMFARLAPRTPTLAHVVGLDARRAGEALDFAALASSPVDTEALAQAAGALGPDALAMVIYTSGTTGRPKGAGMSHRSMLASALAQARHTRAAPTDMLQLSPPLNHVGGITCGILAFLIGGGTIELVPEFKAGLVLDMMARHPPTVIGGVPTMLTLMLMQAKCAQVDLERVRLIYVGGSSVDAALIAQLCARMPRATLMNLYGLSESSGAIVMTPWECSDADLMNTIGRALEGAELKLVDAHNRAVAPGEVGELCFRGAGVIAGYVGAASSAGAFEAGGWLHTGDLGTVDERGFITLKGRQKDMYIQGGFNVYPAEIENFIAQHPKVMMVAGIGVPDPVLGEVGRYYIIPKPGSGLSEAEIRAYCAAHLANYKVPRQIVLREALPLTPAGKIQKSALREEG